MADAPSDEQRAAVAHGRRPLRRVDDPLVRAVARLPVTVRTKLLIAFVGTSMLLVAVGLLGQLVLGQSNDRVVSLGALRERAIAYGQLQQRVSNLRNLLAENVAGGLLRRLDGGRVQTERGGDRSTRDDARCAASRRGRPRIGSASRRPPRIRTPSTDQGEGPRSCGRCWTSELIPLYGEDVTKLERTHVRVGVEELASDLEALVAVLADGTRAEVQELVARNASSFASSRALFIGVAVGALVLALLLGFVLSWSLIGPIQQIDTRLAAIASGTSRATWTSTIETSSERWPPTSTG